MANTLIKVKDILRPDGIIGKVRDTATLDEAVRMMRQRKANSLLVVDADDGLCGLFSEHDAMHALADDMHNALNRPIADIMSVDLVVCTPENTLTEAMRLMSDHSIRHLPVVNEAGHLQGYLEIMDLLRAVQEHGVK